MHTVGYERPSGTTLFLHLVVPSYFHSKHHSESEVNRRTPLHCSIASLLTRRHSFSSQSLDKLTYFPKSGLTLSGFLTYISKRFRISSSAGGGMARVGMVDAYWMVT